MNESEKLLSELKNIRDIMDRSSRFLSLSGLSGILIGIYALAGAVTGYWLIQIKASATTTKGFADQLLIPLIIVATSVLILSLFTILLLTIKKARKERKAIWGPGSRLLLLNLLIPLLAGAVLISIFVFRGFYELIAPGFLVFYGLSLVNAAKYTRPEILGLGIFQLLLGLIAAILPVYGLYFWAFGFGVLHIVYGLVFLRDEHKNKVQ